MERIRAGDDPLDAAIAAVTLVEDDPKEHSVGLGGLPNEDGVVELDCAVMHGPTAKAGAVAALRNIKNPSRVAETVMRRSDHVLLVGDGALRFARAHGFTEEDLLTREAREKWLEWKENLNPDDDWIAPPPKTKRKRAADTTRPTGTIHLSVLDAKGDLAGVTSTSGLAFKLAGRVGDSPIIGAGLYTDNDVGSAGATGRGEACLLTCTSFLIVESMRAGATPHDACLVALRRIVQKTRDPRLLDKSGRPAFDVKVYAIDKQGRYGSASIHQGGQFALHDGNSARLCDCAYLFEKR
jgi:N4-(beta-N-acetylglucosaminyl)-L-asparaginase